MYVEGIVLRSQWSHPIRQGKGALGGCVRPGGAGTGGWPGGGQTRADSRLVLRTDVGSETLTLILDSFTGRSKATCLPMSFRAQLMRLSFQGSYPRWLLATGLTQHCRDGHYSSLYNVLFILNTPPVLLGATFKVFMILLDKTFTPFPDPLLFGSLDFLAHREWSWGECLCLLLERTTVIDLVRDVRGRFISFDILHQRYWCYTTKEVLEKCYQGELIQRHPPEFWYVLTELQCCSEAPLLVAEVKNMVGECCLTISGVNWV